MSRQQTRGRAKMMRAEQRGKGGDWGRKGQQRGVVQGAGNITVEYHGD